MMTVNAERFGDTVVITLDEAGQRVTVTLSADETATLAARLSSLAVFGRSEITAEDFTG